MQNFKKSLPISPPLAARKILNLNSDWLFSHSSKPSMKNADYDDSGFQKICLPHARQKYDLIRLSAEVRANDETLNWYRRHFSLPAGEAGRRVFVEFNGGGQINKVYLNGKFVGESKGHFTSFGFDVTDCVTFGDFDNVIAVRADSQYNVGELPPGGRMFQMSGGLHGTAYMTVTDRAFLDSVFYYNDPVVKGAPSATLRGRIELKNTHPVSKSLTVLSKLFDMDGNEVAGASAEKTVELGVYEETVADLTCAVEAPNLWDTENPYLYTVQTTLLENGVILDQVKTETGIRTLTADPPAEPGGRLYLNGEPVTVIGTNKHMQTAYLSNSIPAKHHARDVLSMKYDMGMNFVRTSHYQHDPEFLTECDRVGIMVEDEPLGMNEAGNWEVFKDSVYKMIKRDRNHASVVMWSVYANERPRDYPSVQDNLDELAVVKSLDPSRLTIQEDHKNSKVTADVYGWHDYNRPHLPHNTPTQPKSWFITEWNNDCGRNFVIPGDSEVRKLKQLLNYSRVLERFHTHPDIMGALIFGAFTWLNNGKGTNKGKGEGSTHCAGVIGPLRDDLDKRWIGHVLKAQGMYSDLSDVLYICSEWKSDSLMISTAEDPFDDMAYPDPQPPANAVYVASGFTRVDLYYSDGGSTRLVQSLSSPNRNPGLPRGLFEFVLDPLLFPWTPTSKLIAKGYRNGECAAKYTRYASCIAVNRKRAKLRLHDTISGRIGPVAADGVDAAWIIAELVDQNGQREYYGEENIWIEHISGDAEVFHGGETMVMTDGLAGFYVRGALDRPGLNTVRVNVNIGDSIDDSLFAYKGDWEEMPALDALGGKYHVSREAGASATVKFTGVQAALYGEHRADYGGAYVSIDGGERKLVSFGCDSKYGVISNQRMYRTPLLQYGEHIMRIEAADARPVAIDRVKVFDGKIDLSGEITVEVAPWETDRVPVPSAGLPFAPEPPVWGKSDLAALMRKASRLADSSVYAGSVKDSLAKQIKSAASVLADSAASGERVSEAAANLAGAIRPLENLF